MMQRKTGVLLVNLGTPASPRPKDVYKYLIEFLTDARVIDLSWWKRQLLVRGLIVPRRYRNSAASYQAIWTEEGSPLMHYGKKAAELLQEVLGDDYVVELAMRYRQPSIPSALEKLKSYHVRSLVVIPLFPQYASATTGSVHQKVMECLATWEVIPALRMVDCYPTQPEMIEAFCDNARRFDLEEYDHFLFSFHGLPVRQLIKADPHGHCQKAKECCTAVCSKNRHCYSAQCYATAEAIRTKLGFGREKSSVCFQSRLGRDPWLEPYASEHLHSLLKRNKKKILVFSPAFAADCLETIYEIGVEYKEEFCKLGGEKLDLVPSLNAHPVWIDGLARIAKGEMYTF